MFSISVQNFSSIDDDHKELSFFLKTDFKTETEILDAWISLNIDPNDMKFLSIYICLRSIRSQSYKSKNAQTKEI